MIINNEISQNTPEWIEARLGKPSASNFHRIVKQNGDLSDQRYDYMIELAGERITGRQAKKHKSSSMDMGHEFEQEAADYYSMLHGIELYQVGFVLDDSGRYGCSPDRLKVGVKSGVEIKCHEPKTQAKMLDKGMNGMSEHHRQLMGQMLICELSDIDLINYCPGMKDITTTVYRDERFLDKLKRELEIFCEELEEMVKRIS